MNYREISIKEYEDLIKNKNKIFNNTYKNTNKIIEDKKQYLKTYPSSIIKQQQKDDYIERLSDMISEKINNNDIEPNDYMYYIKNPNILADKIVEIYNNNPNANIYIPKKKSKVKLVNVANKIYPDQNISEKYKQFVLFFRNIPRNSYIVYDYLTYKNLVLDKIIESKDKDDQEFLSLIDDNSFIKKFGKEFVKNIRGDGINEYNTIKIDENLLKKYILKIQYINGRRIHNKNLRDDMIISNRMKNAILKDTNIDKLSNNGYLVYSHLNKYKNDDTNLLTSSYLAGNVSKDLYNTINKNLYNKLKNNEINKKQYYNILRK